MSKKNYKKKNKNFENQNEQKINDAKINTTDDVTEDSKEHSYTNSHSEDIFQEPNTEKVSSKKNALYIPTRKNNSFFVTSFFSDKGDKASHNNHFTYEELDDFGCWVLAEASNGGGFESEIAPTIGEMIIEEFSKKPSMDPNYIKNILLEINKKIILMQRNMYEEMKQYSYCSFVVMISDYSRVFFANVGNSRGMIIRDSGIKYITCDDTIAHIEYEKGVILHDEIRFRKDKNQLTQKFGLDIKTNINISETMVLLPGDKALLLSQGSWENLSSYDILTELNNNVRCGQWISGLIKKIRTNNTYILNNFTLCGIFFDRPIPFIREPTLWEKIGRDIETHYRKAILLICGLLLLFAGNRYYQNYKLKKNIDDYIARITKNIKTGDARIELPKFDDSINYYNTAMNLYEELKNISNDDKHSSVIEGVNDKIKESETGIKVQNLLKDGDITFDNDQYLSAKNKYQQAIRLLNNLNSKNSWFAKTKDNTIKNIAVCDVLEAAFTKKLEADSLYEQKRTKKKSLEIYEEIAPVFQENKRIRIYEEILAKLNLKEEPAPTPPPKVKKEIPINLDDTNYIALGDQSLAKGRWTESLDYYKKALSNKKYNDPITAQGKINVNNILLRGVRHETAGDDYKRSNDNTKANEKYNAAIAEYKKLNGNKYISNNMRSSILERVQSKLNLK
ncbi:hypothetical protein [Fusobacterium sp. PH5-44]|uniref:PP2C family protein-serine/threonine phosphatase n=1 Tax=unclassified Fusobacterium TaxID=2648384 RepID=UPI003D1FC938